MTNAMANESTFTNFKRELQTLNYAELNYLISDIMLEIKKRSYNEGMVKGMTSGSSAEEVAPVGKLAARTPQQTREDIVEKAKTDTDESLRSRNVEFIVNKEKRTVVALNRCLAKRSNDKEFKVKSRGIAKCDPYDCFNVHIGRAIALRRALGLEVPTEYLNAPQPIEVRVGDVVSYKRPNGEFQECEAIDGFALPGKPVIHYRSVGAERSKIIDDSRENIVEGVTE